MPDSTATLAQRIRRYTACSQVLLLLAALSALLALLWPTPPEDCLNPDSTCSVYGLGERRAENAQLERIAGKSAVFAVQFNQWLSSWWHPPQVFWLLTVLAALVGWGCRREARFLRDLQQHGDGHTPAL